jgi:AcrR family transcriptional regulator
MAQKQPKWRRTPAERPQQILAAALLVFGEAGVANTTLDEIADRAGVSKGTIYLYFPNKEELFRETVRQALMPSKTADQEPPTPPSATRHLLDTLSRQWHSLTAPLAVTLRRLVYAEQWQFPELVELYDREVVTHFAGQLAPIIRRGINTGEFRDVDPKVAARMLNAIVIQTATWSAASTLARGSSGTAFRELSEFCLQAIAPTEAAFPQADGAPSLRTALNN